MARSRRRSRERPDGRAIYAAATVEALVAISAVAALAVAAWPAARALVAPAALSAAGLWLG